MVEIENPHDDPDDPWVLYLIVRESLGMSAGKIGAQCGHAVGMAYEKLQVLKKSLKGIDTSPLSEEVKGVFRAMNNFDAWRNESYRKVVLRADDKEWTKLKEELDCFIVRDAGFTEVPAGSETVIGLWPMKKSQAPKIVKKLQVLK